ncbi:MAG: 50S ribosomal protein L13, partial [Candidatus Dadabacteria bacterium]
PQFTPHADIGDFVIVVNADKVKFTGKKWEQKKYYWHTGYPGGIKSITADDLMKKKPGEILRKAVWGMLPKNKMQDKLISRLKVYTGNEHPHVSQQPENLEV